ncbi:MAG: FeoA family protein [Myxococcota bacterium]|jgi:ferrous iron transport protein A
MDPVVALPAALLQPCITRSDDRRGLERHALTDLAVGVTGLVQGVELAGAMGERLVELGFTRNAPVTVLRRAPFGGPLQVRLRDFMLSLRREQADAIRVRPAEGKGDA